ncbi:MAG: TIGR02099 family protein [Rhodocyclales bacterium]|nr:TIGR02099 family protein [Rhodocyclales bacterium]
MQENTTPTPAPARPGPARRLLRLARLAWLPVWLRRTLAWLFWIGYFGFALIILALRYSVLPNIENYRDDIQRGISQTAGLPVTIAHIDTHWQGLRPHLSLRGFSIHDAAGRPGLTFDTVETELSWASLWHWQLRLHRLEVDAPTLHIRREKNGRVFIAGIQLNTEASGSDFSDWLLAQERIVIRNASIRWEDALRGAPPLELKQLNFVLQNDGRRHRFGLTAEPPRELAARLDVRGDFRGEDLDRLEEWKGEAYAELDYADLAGWRAWVDYPLDLPQGAGGMRLWLGFAEKKLNTLTADIALRDVKLRLARELPMLDLVHLNGRLSGRLPENGFEVASRKLALATRDGIALAPTDFTLRWTPPVGKQAAHGEMAANGLDLDVLTRLAGFLPLDGGTRKTLADYAPHGRIFDLKLGWKGEAGALSGFDVRARFEGLGLRAQGYFPGFVGLTGSIEGNEKGGLASLDSHAAALELPAVFADPRLDFEQLTAKATWTLSEGRIDVQLQNLAFNNKDAAGAASGRYRSSLDGPGEIDITARLGRADGAAVWRYMPLVVNRDVRDWLRASISGGRADDARLRLKGDLKDFPFADGKKGTFQVSAKFAGADLRYAPGWPGIDNISGDLLFEGRRMLISASRGSIAGVTVSAVSAEIPDLEAPEEIITIGGRAAGPTADFLRFIETSPVSEQIDRFTEGMSATGNGTLALKLTMPLRKVANTLIEGDYQFLRNGLTVDADLPPLSEVSGRLQFTGGSVTMKDARAQLLGSPLVINAATRGDGAVAINAQGSLSIAGIRKEMDHRLLEHLSGSAAWRGTVLVKNRNADVKLESSLQGIASSLPEPFNKTSSETMPFRFERSAAASAGAARDQVRINLGNELAAHFLRRHEKGRTVVERGAIGIGETPALPEKGVLLAANVPAFNVDFWRGLFAANGGNGGGGGHPVSQLSLRTAELTAFDRQFNEVNLRASLQDDTWQAQVASRDVTGEFSWKADERGRLRARLKQFTLGETRPGRALIAEEPLRELPGLDIVAENFTLRGRKLGKLELLATNEASAWKMERLAITNPDGALVSDGVWRGGGTQLNFKLDVSDSGKMLERLGYADAVRRGTAKLEGKVSWAGTPTQIDHASLDGTLTAEAAHGQFNKLEPGVGRLLGILSLQSLPRRITLDFRDIFSDGFAFDTITGSARVVHGVMNTQDLLIQGPSAKILMKGEVSIPAETQNLRVRIEPALGETLAVGAMIANPAIGAAAWVAQKILKDPIGKMFAFEYAISGSWSDPKVEKLQQQAAKKSEE